MFSVCQPYVRIPPPFFLLLRLQYVYGRHRSGNGRLPEMEHAISGNASPGPLPRRDGVRCRQRGARYRQHMFPGLAWRTSGNELAHAGNGSFPAWGAHTPGNDPADVDNGSYPARGEHTPGNDRVEVGKGSFPAWGASFPGNGLLFTMDCCWWHGTACTVVLGDLLYVVCGTMCRVRNCSARR